MRVVLLDFDGTAYRGDLAVQAYARRVAELLPPAAGVSVIGAMRAFLESKPKPAGLPPRVEAVFDRAEDGFELVHALADAAGVPTEIRRSAYRGSRADLALTAFAVDEQPGLAAWLHEANAEVWLVTIGPDTAVREVLGAVGIADLVTEIHPGTAKPEGMRPLVQRAVELAGPERVVAIGDRWADVSAAHDAGARSALIDRFDRRLGTPTWRARTLEELLPDLRSWSATTTEDVPRPRSAPDERTKLSATRPGSPADVR